jgi:hypothetical protein
MKKLATIIVASISFFILFQLLYHIYFKSNSSIVENYKPTKRIQIPEKVYPFKNPIIDPPHINNFKKESLCEHICNIQYDRCIGRFDPKDKNGHYVCQDLKDNCFGDCGKTYGTKYLPEDKSANYDYYGHYLSGGYQSHRGGHEYMNVRELDPEIQPENIVEDKNGELVSLLSKSKHNTKGIVGQVNNMRPYHPLLDDELGNVLKKDVAAGTLNHERMLKDESLREPII